MADLIVEDGTIVADANAYCDVAFADDYFATHPFYSDSWSALTVPKKTGGIIVGTSTADSVMDWRGSIVAGGNPLNGYCDTIYGIPNAAPVFAPPYDQTGQQAVTPVATPVQSLRWPRQNVYDLDGRLLPSNVIPLRLKQAVCEIAMYLNSSGNNSDIAPPNGNVTELKIDVIDLKFGPSPVIKPVPKAALRLLLGLGTPYYVSRVRRVSVQF